MRTTPTRIDPLMRATMPATTRMAAMTHKMVSVLPPLFAISIPRVPSMAPPFLSATPYCPIAIRAKRRTAARSTACRGTAPGRAYRGEVTSPIRLVEFPADDPARARRFWNGVLDVELEGRLEGEGEGWQTHGGGSALGLHPRGTGPGDQVSLPYLSVPDMDVALARVGELGGEVIHPGERWSVCRDTEGSPFGLAADLM